MKIKYKLTAMIGLSLLFLFAVGFTAPLTVRADGGYNGGDYATEQENGDTDSQGPERGSWADVFERIVLPIIIAAATSPLIVGISAYLLFRAKGKAAAEIAKAKERAAASETSLRLASTRIDELIGRNIEYEGRIKELETASKETNGILASLLAEVGTGTQALSQLLAGARIVWGANDAAAEHLNAPPSVSAFKKGLLENEKLRGIIAALKGTEAAQIIDAAQREAEEDVV